MKSISLLMLAALLLCLVGCASPTRVAVLEQVGPGPGLGSQKAGEGCLQVYSARERNPIDVNAEEFFWNNDFGKNEFLHSAAHTGYSIYSPDGRLLRHVSNTTGMNDSNPTLVRLSPGVYRIEADAEDYNDVTLTVLVPVCIKPGMTTTLHLDGNWSPPAALVRKSDDTVRLPNGNIVGWRFSNSGSVEDSSKVSG